MRSIVLIWIIGLLFLGCASNKVTSVKRASIEDQAEKSREISKKYPAGCQLLKSGYLVCPKKR